jgi:hypothetical protein
MEGGQEKVAHALPLPEELLRTSSARVESAFGRKLAYYDPRRQSQQACVRLRLVVAFPGTKLRII